MTRSFVTSYNGLFGRRSLDGPVVEHIEIPLIQRDYAQGRGGKSVQRIRDNFIDVLHRAILGGEPVSLDFVYGDVEGGTLRPLDGQQRLTTLFLLHWYLAFRADQMGQLEGWKQFTYATRASARLFCERLVEHQPGEGTTRLSEWIEDQAWYLQTWRHDPTIRSMLVVLDAIHERFRDDDCLAAWNRLVHPGEPAISFHLLPIEQLGLNEDLYIKMNSRGKPLTEFENFKARFEKTLESSCPGRVKEFALKVDGPWSDLLWPYRGDDNIIDDEFLRYFHFVTELCEWRAGRPATGEVGSLADAVYGPGNPGARVQLDFLIRALDTWVGVNIAAFFEGLFARRAAPIEMGDTAKVVISGQQSKLEINLFEACCRNYGEARGRIRVFTLQHTILLYAVLLHRLDATADFPLRLRVLRNLVEASSNEVRIERMPMLIADVERVVVDGSLDDVSAFNQAQVADERLKEALLARHPELERSVYQLEDHPLLRGCLAAFDLDEAVLERRGLAFHRLFSERANLPAITGALLATGDYARQLNARFFLLGSASNQAPWRDLLTGAARGHVGGLRVVLGRLLDEVAQAGDAMGACLDAIQARWLAEREAASAFDWRYYFVKYAAMREGRSGIYAGWNGTLGYSVCMLNGQRVSGYYRDPYLLAIHRDSGLGGAVQDPWFIGYESNPRWMHLVKSGAQMRCVEAGIALKAPLASQHTVTFSQVCAEHHVGSDLVLRVPKVEHGGKPVDAMDRVQLGAALLRDLVAGGL